jgi:hypothetical protein
MTTENDFLNSLESGQGISKRTKEIYIIGRGGIGKSGLTLTDALPNRFYITLEAGNDWHDELMFKNSNGNGVVPQNFEQAMLMLKKISTKSYRDSLPIEIKTIVIDSITFLQDLIYADIVTKNPTVTNKNGTTPTRCIDDLGFAGFGLAMTYWQRFFSFVDYFKAKGMHVVLIGHATAQNTTTDSNQSTKVWNIALQAYGQHNVQNLVEKRCDAILHLYTTRNGVTVGAGKWSKTIADGNTQSKTVVQTRETSLRYAKVRTTKGNEHNIPDAYYFDSHDRDDVSAEIFNQLINN